MSKGSPVLDSHVFFFSIINRGYLYLRQPLVQVIFRNLIIRLLLLLKVSDPTYFHLSEC
jgi:hypothetical protein